MRNFTNGSYFKILAVDPGMSLLGWAYTHYYNDTGKFIVQEHGVIKPYQLSQKNKEERDIIERRILTSEIVKVEYRKLVEKYKCDYHASESAFFHPKRPEAFISLSLCIHTLMLVLYNLYKEHKLSNMQATLHKFAPKLIKKTISEDGTSDKDKIYSSLLEHPHISFVNPLEKPLTEHEADAISCAYTLAKNINSLTVSIIT